MMTLSVVCLMPGTHLTVWASAGSAAGQGMQHKFKGKGVVWACKQYKLVFGSG